MIWCWVNAFYIDPALNHHLIECHYYIMFPILRFNTYTFLYKAAGVLGTFTRLNMAIYFINYFWVLGAAGSSS